MSENAEFIYSADGQRRVVILRLAAGQYSYREEYHYHSESAEGWASLGGRASYYDSLETARREVVFNVPWLAAERTTA